MPIQVGGENVNVEQSLKSVACEYSRFSLPLAAQDVSPQCAKKVVSDSPGLVDFAIGLVNSVFKGAMSHTAHVHDEALHLENVRQLFQVLRVIQYQEFIVIYRSHPLTVRIVKR